MQFINTLMLASLDFLFMKRIQRIRKRILKYGVKRIYSF